MGREILYCTKCGKALTADDFTRGRAHTFDNRQFCAKCLPPRVESSHALRPAKRAPSSTRMQPAVRTSKSSPLPMVFGALAAVAVVGVLIVVLQSPAPAPSTSAAPEPPSRKLLDDAREFARVHAKSPDDVVRRWEEAVAAAGSGPLAAEARRELDRALGARKEGEARELKELEGRILDRLQAEQFGPAVDVLEEARKRHLSTDWAKGVEGLVQGVRSTIDQRYPALKAKAVAARAQGADAELAEVRKKLALWGRRDLEADLEAELAKIIPREAPPAGAVVLHRFPWDGPRAWNLCGTIQDGALRSPPYGNGAVMGGWEVIQKPWPIPEKGEFWLTYSTTSPKPIMLRFRIIDGDRTRPYNWTIEKPEVGRPARVKAPLREFMNYDNKYVEVGQRVQSIYIQQDEPGAVLLFHEAVVFRIGP